MLATQTGRARAGSTPGIRLLEAPHMSAIASARRPGRVFAGPFSRLKATGTASGSGLAARTTHTFAMRAITTSWSLRRSRGSRALNADVLLPSHGSRATIEVLLRDGRTIRLGRTPVGAAKVRAIAVRSDDSGYAVRLLRAPRGATISAVAVRGQSSAPDPGPSLAVRLARGTAWRSTGLTARLTPDPALAARAR